MTLIATLAAIWTARPAPAPPPTRLEVVTRLTQPVDGATTPERLGTTAALRWGAAELEQQWRRVESGSGTIFRSPQLPPGSDLHSIVVTRPPAHADDAAPVIMWSDRARLNGAELARRRREIPARGDAPATLVIEAEALQSDERKAVLYLFLHLPRGGAVADSIESIAAITAADLAAAGVSMSRVAADGQTRDAFAAAAPLTFRVDVPRGAQLAFGVRAPRTAPAAQIRVVQTVGGREQAPFEAALTPEWADHRVPLREGRDSTLTLSIDRPLDRPAYWSVPLLLAPRASGERPNVVVVVVDALRADVIGAFGARESATPFLDRLAADSVVFRRAYAPASWTKPSIATLLTSLYPWTHRLGARYYADPLPADVPTLQSVLSAHGYATVQFSANPFTGAASGLDRGFDAAIMAPALGHRNAFDVTGADIVDHFLAWAAERSREHFFAYLHLVDTHGAKGLDGYRGMAAAADRELARLHAGLRELPSGERTMLIVTADHGEAFGEHGHVGHGQSIYEEEIRVPLLVAEPRPGRAHVVNEPVHLVDVMPTVLDYAGIALETDTMQGRSLRPQPGARPSPVVVTKFTYPEDLAGAHDRAEMHGLVDFPWKLIVVDRPGAARARELYRLDTDPGERRNLAAAEAARARRLEAALEAFLREQTAARARFVSAFQRGIIAAPAPSREVVDQLRSLGYVR